MITKRQFDNLGRLVNIANTPAGAGQLPASYAYAYNDANQRTRMTLADGSYWEYRYDSLGQVTSGKHYWPDNTPVPGQQFEYGFDDIGNRNSTKAGGDSSGQNLRSSTYTANMLNQYSQRTVPGGFDVLGLATAANSVTVNGSAADYRRGEYFQESVSVSNGSGAVWQSVTVNAGTASSSGNRFVPPATESYGSASNPSTYPGYDLDGNLLRDGRWKYTWDGENRLTKMEPLDYVTPPSGSRRQLDFEYDALGRRIKKTVTNLDTSAVTTTKFLYDGWNLMAELDGSNSLVRVYQWGLDLSGSLQGAGGVGGLLSVKPSSGIAQFQGYDGNGNVMLAVEGSGGTRSAEFEYGPFGETLRASGTSAGACLSRFSTKYQDGDSSLYYYGYRYYDTSMGRWLNRDPIQERGGLNLFGFVRNNPVSLFDRYGLEVPAYDSVDANPSTAIDLIIDDIAKDAGLTVEETLKRISICKAIHTAYSLIECKGCKWGCFTKAQAQERAACWATQVGLRSQYLRLKCDYVLLGSITKVGGSVAAEKGHRIAVVEKLKALAYCTAKAAQP